MACDPVESVLVVQTADVTPLLVESVGVHSTLVPSVNVNVPPGGVTAAEPGARTFTIAVNVTACPETAGLAEEVTAVVVDALITVCGKVAELELLFESPG